MNTYIKLLFDGEFEKADRLMQAMIPDKLYKYVSLSDDESSNEKRFKCIEDNTFFFSAVNKENDPYEFKGIYLAEEELVNLGWPSYRAKSISSVYDLGTMFSITCLTENDEHCLPMWAYYTNEYRGYCIEYNVDNPARIYKVLYEDKRSSGAVTVSQLLFAHKEENEEEAKYLRRILKIALYMKHKSWSWEKEYRILDELPSETSPGTKVALDRIGLRTSRIITGINCKPEHQKRLRTICRNNSIAYNKAIISKTSFGFEEE